VGERQAAVFGTMKKTISLKINGVERSAAIEARTTLLEMVRDEFDLTAAKLGCDIQVCGACTVLVNGRPVSACSMLALDADRCEVLTLEGLGQRNSLHPLQQSFIESGALQCGYCTSGFILTAKALLDEYPQPTDEQIREYLAGNFCRCGCYPEIVQAISKVAKES
jgi:aerobic carbon-monoxide dehydrogenase small subunit